VEVDRDAAAVVGDLATTVREETHGDDPGVAREVLVDRVVHHLPDQVVQPADVRGADVHRGSLAHTLEPLEDADALGAVVGHGVASAGGR
jgi:hypothetical protein